MDIKKVTALVPMKGHSERVPNKNMRDFGGAPLYHAIMATLDKSQYVEKVIINTDSEVIAEDATKHWKKVQINWRPEELRGDFVSMNDVINYDVDNEKDSDVFMQTHSTNPLLTTETLDAAIAHYFKSVNEGYDSVFGVTKFQSRFYWADGRAINHNPAELIRTQDLPPIFEENSNFYIFSRESFKAAGNKRIGLHPAMFAENKLEAIDIDDPDDFALALALYNNKK